MILGLNGSVLRTAPLSPLGVSSHFLLNFFDSFVTPSSHLLGMLRSFLTQRYIQSNHPKITVSNRCRSGECVLVSMFDDSTAVSDLPSVLLLEIISPNAPLTRLTREKQFSSSGRIKWTSRTEEGKRTRAMELHRGREVETENDMSPERSWCFLVVNSDLGTLRRSSSPIAKR